MGGFRRTFWIFSVNLLTIGKVHPYYSLSGDCSLEGYIGGDRIPLLNRVPMLAASVQPLDGVVVV